MTFEERLEKERKKYIDTYKISAYKMGDKRKHHAVSILKTWPPSSYLDVGCGRGEMLDEANNLGFSRSVGVEIVPELIQAREDVMAGDGANLPFVDREIDYVSMLDVVEHIPDEDIYDVFRELGRVSNIKILLCIANFRSVMRGVELHINIKSYKEWNDILIREFPEWEVKWLPRGRNISETWELTRV
jgi:ubiquinone/menaquinone biosynthesis C-methylase UbiE